MLKLGSFDRLHIRQINLPSGCNLRILYISDLHLSRWASHIVQQLLDVCQQTTPDVIVLGGDLVDSSSGLSLLSHVIQEQQCPVYALAGNHDEWVGIQKVRDCVIKAGGHWLESVVYLHPQLAISGVCEYVPAQYTILCTHDPVIFPDAVHANFDLTLAGHLHGGQCIIMTHQGKHYPGAFLSSWTGDKFMVSNSMLVVSKGVHDTLPIRWNCPREVILCCC